MFIPVAMVSVIFRLFNERPKDCLEEEDDAQLDDSEDGFPGVFVSPFNLSFSAFSISISFYKIQYQVKASAFIS